MASWDVVFKEPGAIDNTTKLVVADVCEPVAANALAFYNGPHRVNRKRTPGVLVEFFSLVVSCRLVKG